MRFRARQAEQRNAFSARRAEQQNAFHARRAEQQECIFVHAGRWEIRKILGGVVVAWEFI